MNVKELAVNTMQQVVAEIAKTTNNIDNYLASDAPAKYHRQDISNLLGGMKTRVAKIILDNAGLTAKQ